MEQKWEESAWAKRRAVREKRRNLTDFDRFRVLRLNKQVSIALSCSGAGKICNCSVSGALPCETVDVVRLVHYLDGHRLITDSLETFRGS